MIHCHDQRPIDEIRNELLGSRPQDIDLPNLAVVLCERIGQLDTRINKLEKDLAYTANTASCLANGIIPD